MSGSNCRFLTHIQVSQETSKVVWYYYLFKNFPQFVMIHTVKDFAVVNETEIDVFLEFPCFFLWSNECWEFDFWFFFLLLLNPACTYGCFRLIYCWNLAWRILSKNLLACEMSTTHTVVWILFGIALLWDENENWPFQVLWPLFSLPNLLMYWVEHFNRSTF